MNNRKLAWIAGFLSVMGSENTLFEFLNGCYNAEVEEHLFIMDVSLDRSIQ